MLNINDLAKCYTCFKCAGVCPVGLRPVAFVKAYLGLKFNIFGDVFEDLMKDSSVWYCAKCFKCTEICPQKVPLHEVIEYLQYEAAKRGFVPQTYLNMIENIMNTYLAFTSQTIISREGDFFVTEDVMSLFRLSFLPKIKDIEKFREKLKEMIRLGQ